MTADSSARHAVLAELLAAFPEVREGRMFGHPAWFVGRRMFACVYGDGVGLKLPAAEVATLLAAPEIVPFQPYGKARMREWLQINRIRAADYRQDVDKFARAVRYAQLGK